MSTSIARHRTSKAGSRYFQLVAEFPLRPIRSDAELDRAITVVDSLLDRGRLSADERDYLDVLAELIESYEETTNPIQPASDAEMLAFLIDARRTDARTVARATEIPKSTLSAVVRGRRQLTREQLTRVAAYFHVDPGVFAAPTGTA